MGTIFELGPPRRDQLSAGSDVVAKTVRFLVPRGRS